MRDGASLWTSAATLWRRELLRFFRQRSRVIGSFGAPFLFWLLFSSGYTPSGGSSFAFFVPGTVALIVLFTSIFTNISIIEDRREGFLQGVLVAPVPRAGIVLGKVLGGASIAGLQALLFLLVARVGGSEVSLASPLWLGAVLLLGISVTALGFGFAWRLDSVQGFHGVMNLLLMPMWVLSGALFPAQGTPGVLKALIVANPVTYGVGLLRHGLGGAGASDPSLVTCLAVSLLFGAVTISGAIAVAARTRST